MSTKRLLASLLALLMLFSLLPAAALAEEPESPAETGEPEAAPPADETQDDGLTGFFLVGSMNGWTPAEEYRFTWESYDANTGVQWVFLCTLSVGDEFKAVQVENGSIVQWFPDNMGNYVVDAAHAGYKAVYFRPVAQSDSAFYGGHLLVDDPPAPKLYHVNTYINSPVHGSLSVSPEDAYEGDPVTITATPEAGYMLQYIEGGSITKVNDTTYTTVMPGADLTVYATFKLAPGYYFDNTNRVVPDYYVPEEAFSPSASSFGEWERETVLTEGNYLDVRAVYAPENANNKTGYFWCDQTMKLTYSSSNDRPKATAEQAGHAMVFLTETEREGYIKAIHLSRSYYGETYTYDAWITIKSFHTITVAQTNNGSAAADLTEAYEGQTVTLTATPASGYRLGAFTVLDADGNEIPVEGNSFAMPDGPVTVTASFIPEGAVTYTVTVDANIANGSVTPDKTSAAEGEAVNLTVAPDEGYQLETLTVTDANGDPVELNGTSFLMPASNVTVTATFVLIPPPTYTVTVDASIQNGSVTADKETALEGETVSLTVTPAPGYELGALTVTAADGSPVELNGTSFLMPAANVTVTASFVPVYYTITLVGGGEGVTITSNKQTAMEGENVDVNTVTDQDHSFVSITVTDEQGHEIETTKRPDGANKYRFVMPASNVTVTVVTKYNPKYQLWVGGIQVTGDNCSNILGDGSASYEPATRTLSFSSAEPAITGEYGGNLITYMGEDSLTIEAPNGLHLDASQLPSATQSIYSYYASFVINGDLTLDVPNGIQTYNGTVTVNGNVTGSGQSTLIQGNAGVTVNGTVTTTNPASARAIYSDGPVRISGDLVSAGFGNTCVYAGGDIAIDGDVTIAFSTTQGLCALLSTGGSVSVGGSFTSRAKASQYVVNAAQGFTCAGDVTVFNNFGKGIYSANGAITVVSGTWNVTASSEPLKAAGGIVIPATHAITTPEGGVLAETGGFTVVTEADGTTPAVQVIIEPAQTPAAITVTFNAGEGTVDPATVEVNAGEAIGELPTPTREGWKFLGWFTEPAENAFVAGQGTQVTTETTFNEDTTVYAHWRLPGDINGDGSVNNKDVTRLTRWLKFHDVEVVSFNLDVNGDGSVNNKDLTRLVRYQKSHDVVLN